MNPSPSPARAARLAKRLVDLADPTKGRHILWDGELRGFGVQIEPAGTKTYFVRYRPKGLGRDVPRRFFKKARTEQSPSMKLATRQRAFLAPSLKEKIQRPK